MSDAATQVADLVRYRGAKEVEAASAVEVVQFKYSIAHASVPMRAADAANTLGKFAQAERDFVERVGRRRVEAVVRYELATNRPIHPNLLSAIDGLVRDTVLVDDVADQAGAIRSATRLDGDLLRSFLARLVLAGGGGSLSEVRASVHRTLAGWGGSTDVVSQMRLANVCDLVRDKAGGAGQRNNVIERVAVLAALGVTHEDEFFPTPHAFPPIGQIVERPIADAVIAKLDDGIPVLVHAAGGFGKTVLMQALAHRLDGENAVVLFDCFGAGRWRDPADGRHLPQRALPHVVNILAGRGLCGILLPVTSLADLIRAFRGRLQQSVETLRHVYTRGHVVLLLDGVSEIDRLLSDLASHA